jgi:hypothetical protein
MKILDFAKHWNLIASSLVSDATQVGSWISFILISVPPLDSFILRVDLAATVYRFTILMLYTIRL